MAVLYIFLAILALSSAQSTTLELIKFDELFSLQTGARCLDGTPAGYYFRRGTGSGSTRWIVYMQGGGECSTQASCDQRALTARGSSNYFTPTELRRGNLVDDNATVNPDFYNWNHIYIPYCTGDFFTGTQLLRNEWGYFFSGHFHVRGVIQHATQFFGMESATHILVSGSSAGALGAFTNSDVIAGMVPGAIVKATPQDGWFFPDDVDDFGDWLDGRKTPLRDMYKIWDALLDTDCVRDNPGELSVLCTSVGTNYKYMETPAFVLNNRFDSCLVYTFLGTPRNDSSPTTLEFLEYAGEEMRKSMDQVIQSPKNDGIFMMSCLEHVGNNGLQDILIDGLTYGQVLGDWFFERNQLPHIVVDDCGPLPCTPGCRGIPEQPTVCV